MLHIALCEDDAAELSLLSSMLEHYEKLHPRTIEYDGYPSAVPLLAALDRTPEAYDIFLLDILMPEVNGMDAARMIRQRRPAAPILFLTATTDFVEESYSVGARYYLLKPITEARLFRQLDQLCEAASHLPADQRLLLHTTDGSLYEFRPQSLLYAEASRNTFTCHLRNGTAVECLGPFAAFISSLLALPDFFKPHRSYVVHLTAIQELCHTELHMQNGDRIPIARGLYEPLKAAYLRACSAAEEGYDG